MGSIFFQNTKLTCILFYNLGGVSIFSPKTQKCHVYFCTTKGGGGWVPKGPKSQKYVQMCIHVCTLYICHLAPPPPRRLNILCKYVTPDWYFSSGIRNLFCLKSISNNVGEAVFVKHVVCICVVCLEVVGHNL